MKYLLFIFLTSIILRDIGAAQNTPDEQLPIIDTFMGKRITNVGIHSSLYPSANLGLVVNCHPYDPTTVSGSSAPACASHPLIVSYEKERVADLLPESIRKIFDSVGSPAKIFLNVQDNPWMGTQVELRAHAFSSFFPAMGTNYQGVNVFVCRDDGSSMLKASGSVHLHDSIASPDNFAIPGLNHKKTEAFYSIVTYGGNSVITRHILLPVPVREKFQDALCPAKARGSYSLDFFTPLLNDKFSSFLSCVVGEEDILALLDAPQASISFVLKNSATFFGQDVYVVGNIAELGNWKPENAVPMEFQASTHDWSKNITLPTDTTIEYKYIKKNKKGEIIWISGVNLSINAGKITEISDQWK